MSSSDSLLPLTEAFYFILLTLHQQTCHGYAIMQTVESISSGRVTIGAGTLYTALATLLKKGLIQGAESDDSADSRRKRYAITELGIQVLKDEIARLEHLVAVGRMTLQEREGGEIDA